MRQDARGRTQRSPNGLEDNGRRVRRDGRGGTAGAAERERRALNGKQRARCPNGGSSGRGTKNGGLARGETEAGVRTDVSRETFGRNGPAGYRYADGLDALRRP